MYFDNIIDNNDSNITGIVEPKLNEITKCLICKGSENEDVVLVCDGLNCVNEIHMYCLNPILTVIPEGSWYCPNCDSEKEIESLQQLISIYKNDIEFINDFSISYNERQSLLQQRRLPSDIYDDYLANNENNILNIPRESEFNSSDINLIGALMKLKDHFNDRIFHGRIIYRRKMKEAWEHLVQFKSSGDGRNKSVLHWLYLDEIPCCIGYDIVWAKIAGFPWWPALKWSHSSMDLLENDINILEQLADISNIKNIDEIATYKKGMQSLYFFGDDSEALMTEEEANALILPFNEKSSEIKFGVNRKLSFALSLTAVEIEERNTAIRGYNYLSIESVEQSGSLVDGIKMKNLKVIQEESMNFPLIKKLYQSIISNETMPDSTSICLDTLYLIDDCGLLNTSLDSKILNVSNKCFTLLDVDYNEYINNLYKQHMECEAIRLYDERKSNRKREREDLVESLHKVLLLEEAKNELLREESERILMGNEYQYTIRLLELISKKTYKKSKNSQSLIVEDNDTYDKNSKQTNNLIDFKPIKKNIISFPYSKYNIEKLSADWSITSDCKPNSNLLVYSIKHEIVGITHSILNNWISIVCIDSGVIYKSRPSDLKIVPKNSSLYKDYYKSVTDKRINNTNTNSGTKSDVGIDNQFITKESNDKHKDDLDEDFDVHNDVIINNNPNNDFYDIDYDNIFDSNDHNNKSSKSITNKQLIKQKLVRRANYFIPNNASINIEKLSKKSSIVANLTIDKQLNSINNDSNSTNTSDELNNNNADVKDITMSPSVNLTDKLTSIVDNYTNKVKTQTITLPNGEIYTIVDNRDDDELEDNKTNSNNQMNSSNTTATSNDTLNEMHDQVNKEEIKLNAQLSLTKKLDFYLNSILLKKQFDIKQNQIDNSVIQPVKYNNELYVDNLNNQNESVNFNNSYMVNQNVNYDNNKYNYYPSNQLNNYLDSNNSSNFIDTGNYMRIDYNDSINNSNNDIPNDEVGLPIAPALSKPVFVTNSVDVEYEIANESNMILDYCDNLLNSNELELLPIQSLNNIIEDIVNIKTKSSNDYIINQLKFREFILYEIINRKVEFEKMMLYTPIDQNYLPINQDISYRPIHNDYYPLEQYNEVQSNFIPSYSTSYSSNDRTDVFDNIQSHYNQSQLQSFDMPTLPPVIDGYINQYPVYDPVNTQIINNAYNDNSSVNVTYGYNNKYTSTSVIKPINKSKKLEDLEEGEELEDDMTNLSNQPISYSLDRNNLDIDTTSSKNVASKETITLESSKNTNIISSDIKTDNDSNKSGFMKWLQQKYGGLSQISDRIAISISNNTSGEPTDTYDHHINTDGKTIDEINNNLYNDITIDQTIGNNESGSKFERIVSNTKQKSVVITNSRPEDINNYFSSSTKSKHKRKKYSKEMNYYPTQVDDQYQYSTLNHNLQSDQLYVEPIMQQDIPFIYVPSPNQIFENQNFSNSNYDFLNNQIIDSGLYQYQLQQDYYQCNDTNLYPVNNFPYYHH